MCGRCAAWAAVLAAARAFPLASCHAELTASAGFVLHKCLMHGRFAWRVRSLPAVHRAFAAAYGDDAAADQRREEERGRVRVAQPQHLLSPQGFGAL